MVAFISPGVLTTRAPSASDAAAASAPCAAARAHRRAAARAAAATAATGMGPDEPARPERGVRAADPLDGPVSRWSPAAALERAAAVAVVAPVPSSVEPADRHEFRPEHAVCEGAVELALAKIYAQLFGDRFSRVSLPEPTGRLSGKRLGRPALDARHDTCLAGRKDEGLQRAEDMFRAGLIPVRAFVSMVVKSETYRDLFFSRCPQVRFIELNFKHILGRAPASQEEIARHVLIYSEAGYDAEMDSYTDSDEYAAVFGEDVIPHMQIGNIPSQLPLNPNTFNRTVKILNSVDVGTSPVLGLPVARTQTPVHELPKFFKVSYTASSECQETSTIAVPFLSLNRKVSIILRCGGEVLSVDPIVESI